MGDHFDEKSGIVKCLTTWGAWWQTMDEIFIEVEINDVKSKDIKINISAKRIDCTIKDKIILKGELKGSVRADESIWTLEDGKTLQILLVKGISSNSTSYWPSLLVDQYAPNPLVAIEMQKKLDLEKYQKENPGFDFSGANLDKCYD